MGILPQLRTTRDDVFISAENLMNATVALNSLTAATSAAPARTHAVPVQTDTAFVNTVRALGRGDITRVVQAMVLSKVSEVIPGTTIQA